MADNIAMGFQGVQLPNPLDAYAKVMSIQNAQNQNALAQYQLGSARRADEGANRLQELVRGFAPGTPMPEQVNQLTRGGFLKEAQSLAETNAKVGKDKREGEKSAMEMIGKKMDIAQRFLSGVDPNAPTTPNTMMQWFKGALADQDLGPLMAQRGLTETSLADSIEQAIKTPGGMDKLVNGWRLGATEFAKLNKPHFAQTDDGGTISQVQTPGMGGAPVITPIANKVASPGEILRNETQIRGQNLTKTAADERLAAKGDDPKLKLIPPHVNTAIIKNDQSLSKIDKAIGLLEGTAEGGDKKATGMKGYLPNVVLNRAYPEGAQTRAVISDIGSLKLHDRSGAAITASEFPRLAPFIPSATDEPKVALIKLRQLREAAAGEQEALQQTYSEGQGYRPSPVGKGSAPSNLDALLDKYK